MIQFFTTIKNGAITNGKVWRKYISQLADGYYTVKIENKKKRSLNQSNYYWGVVIPIVLDGLRDIGYNDVKTSNDTHEILKKLFLRKDFTNGKTGDVIPITGSTAELTTAGFNEFIEDISEWAAEYLSVVIPAPNTSQDLWSGYAEAATSQKK